MLQFIDFLSIYGVPWGLFVGYSRSVSVIHMCNFTDIFVQGHKPVMWNVYIPVLPVTLVIALSSYEVYIVT